MTAFAHAFPTALDFPCRPAPAAVPLTLVPEAPSQAVVFRRRRVVAAVVLTAIALVVGAALNSAVAAIVASQNEPHLIAQVSAPQAASWTVHSGDTLWSIAVASYPDKDPREVVAKMQAAGVSSRLQVGQTIQLP